MKLQVETYPGSGGVDFIRKFRLGERTVEVTENLDQWYGRDYRYFKVIGADGNLYILRHDDSHAEWDVTLYRTPHIGGILKSLHAKK